jgi:hypothetical protein
MVVLKKTPPIKMRRTHSAYLRISLVGIKVLFSPAYLCLRGVLHPDPLVGEVIGVEFLANINASEHKNSVINTVPDRIGLNYSKLLSSWVHNILFAEGYACRVPVGRKY